MAENKKLSKGEIEKAREGQRQVAIKNLKGNIGNLASVYLIENSGQFGEAVGAAVEQFIYNPSLSMDEVREELKRSRQGGKRYSGTFNEYAYLENAYGIFQQSLPVLKLNDLYELMGSKARDGGDVYLLDMPEEKVQATVGMYQNHLMYSRVAKATGETAKKIPGDLEKLLTEEPKDSKKK
ncbi:MAG: hypothetical protein AABX93_02860 [Nanoarchaeota archaeon]